jgi:hypothetical protein
MKRKLYASLIGLLFVTTSGFGQGLAVDSSFTYSFTPLSVAHHKRVLIDIYHPTIFKGRTNPYEDKVMLDILTADKFSVAFTEEPLLYAHLKKQSDILVIAGLPNQAHLLSADDPTKTTLWKSPLSSQEVEGITKWVFEGGSLLLFMSHFPSGSGGKPLLEALSVKFRDGYAYHPDHPGLTPTTLCSWFTMTRQNGLIRPAHPLLRQQKDPNLQVKTVKWLCGATVFRNPEDVILSYPPRTVLYTPEVGRDVRSFAETSDQYAGMIGFAYGKGRVVVCADQGQFRNNLFKNKDRTVYVTINDPQADNAALLISTMRWLGQIN